MRSNISGFHLILDAVVKDGAILDDIEPVRQLLSDIVELLGMRALAPPHVFRVDLDPDKKATDDDEGGVTGFCVISTSHIAIHTWPLRRRFSMDVFSCRDFEMTDVLEFVKKRLSVTAYTGDAITRHWPLSCS